MSDAMGPVLVFDQVVGTALVTTVPKFNRFLGQYDKYTLHAVVGPTANALTATLTVRLKQSSDERAFTNKNTGNAEINGSTITNFASGPTNIYGYDANNQIGGGFGQLEVNVSASSAHVQIYATGRNT